MYKRLTEIPLRGLHTHRKPLFTAWVVLFAALNCGAQIIWYNPNPNYSIARNWNERMLEAIRMDTPHPPVQARNLFTFSVCMYDAWAAYDTNAVGFVYHGKHTAADVTAARNEAISYAVYRMMVERYAYSRTATNQIAHNPDFMTAMGYDPNNVSRDTNTPAGVGNSIYDAVSAWFINDGSRQTNGTPYPLANPPKPYPDAPANAGGYVFVNPQLVVALPGISDGTNNNAINDVNRWQRLFVANSIDQNGFPFPNPQPYVGAQWLGVRPYQLARIDPTLPWIDPGPPPYFGTASHAQFIKEVVAVLRASSQLTADDGEMIDISPGAFGNNSLGYVGDYGTNSFTIYDGHGYPTNPITGLPYAPNLVKRGDFARVLAEFWADGPSSETPPGHWNVVANEASDNPLLVKRIGGTGPIVNRLEWDVKMYFSLNAAVHEAACSCWAVKRYYNAWRPLSVIRYLAGVGQCSDPALTNYNVNGIPLVTNLIEMVTDDSVNSGRHAGLTPGKIAVYAWPGQPEFPDTDVSGVHWIHMESWIAYQLKTFVTPAFPGYISGHSTFSRSAAEVLTALTGSPFVPGGLGSHTAVAGTATRLRNEFGPSQPTSLQWATYYDAADQAGLSRIFGGIHPPIDNLWGRRVGAQVGQAVWSVARKYFDGSIINTPVNLTLRKLDSGKGELRFNTIRAMYYELQSKTNLADSFVSMSGGTFVRAYDSSIAITNDLNQPAMFYRAVQRTSP
ncbi:MAG: vanadium-dependent haloperoxidase [Verrucomicrobiota bacterium]